MGVTPFFAELELENIGSELLGESRGTLAFALEVLQKRAADADDVEGSVVIEALVLAGEDRFAEISGDLSERHQRALVAVDAADFLA